MCETGCAGGIIIDSVCIGLSHPLTSRQAYPRLLVAREKGAGRRVRGDVGAGWRERKLAKNELLRKEEKY